MIVFKYLQIPFFFQIHSDWGKIFANILEVSLKEKQRGRKVVQRAETGKVGSKNFCNLLLTLHSIYFWIYFGIKPFLLLHFRRDSVLEDSIFTWKSIYLNFTNRIGIKRRIWVECLKITHICASPFRKWWHLECFSTVCVLSVLKAWEQHFRYPNLSASLTIPLNVILDRSVQPEMFYPASIWSKDGSRNSHWCWTYVLRRYSQLVNGG